MQRGISMKNILTCVLAALLSGCFLTAAMAENRFVLHDASQHYNFVIQLDTDCSPPAKEEYGTCEGPGMLVVSDKKNRSELQKIRMDNIFISFAGKDEPLVNSARMYDYQGVINVGDFDFDGHEDFAVQNGNNGPYGGPTYDVYLYSKAGNRFVLSESLTNLISETLGFFQVDSRQKLIKTSAKSGCCYHEYVEYKVVKGEPVPVYRVIEDALNSGDDEYVTVTKERFHDGRWHSTSEKIKIKEYYR